MSKQLFLKKSVSVNSFAQSKGIIAFQVTWPVNDSRLFDFKHFSDRKQAFLFAKSLITERG